MVCVDETFRLCPLTDMQVIEVTALQEKPITIGSRPTYGAMPQSPAIPPSPALAFTVSPAVGQTGAPTVALFAAGLLPGRYAEIYGGRIPGALAIVAVDTRTGEIYHNGAERGHSAPISAVMHPAPQPPKLGQATVDSIELYFAVDLRAQLQLPSWSSQYSLFLWLDEMTSAARQIELPGPPPDNIPSSATASTIAYSLMMGPPTTAPTEIALRESGGRLAGEIGSDLLSQSARYLSLVALDYRSRAFTGRSFELPAGYPQGSNVSFQLVCSELFAGPGWLDAPRGPRSVFVLAALGGALSRVLVLTA
jgi:hypothetical protein